MEYLLFESEDISCNVCLTWTGKIIALLINNTSTNSLTIVEITGTTTRFILKLSHFEVASYCLSMHVVTSKKPNSVCQSNDLHGVRTFFLTMSI